MKYCADFTEQRAFQERRAPKAVLLVLLLTDSHYQQKAIDNFYSVDKFLLKENIDALWHIPFHSFLPDGVTHHDSINNYKFYSTQHNNTFITLNESLFLPDGITSFEETRQIHPKEFCHPKHNLSYSLATRYYTYQMLTLDILSNYDYFMKIDADVRIFKPIWVDSLLVEDVVFVHTSKFAKDVPLCDKTALPVAKMFCLLREWRNPHTIYYSNFIIGWLGLFTSPQSLAFSKYHWSKGWNYRWGDQTFWHYALLVTNATHRVLDASFLRKNEFFKHKA